MRIVCAPVLVAVLLTGLNAQQGPPLKSGVSLVQDWSHQHVIYTNGGSAQQRAMAMRDPRALHNWIAHTWRTQNMKAAAQASPNLDGMTQRPGFGHSSIWRNRVHAPTSQKNSNTEIDWAVSLGANGGFAEGETPAKFQFDVSKPADCTNDFVVYTINATPGRRQANIVAFNNLYRGAGGKCGTGSATIMWSYRVGTGKNYLSPVLSLDGTKVAFIENDTEAVFHVLKWTAGEGTSATSPVVPASSKIVNINYTTVSPAPIGCTNTPAVTTAASPFIDYDADGAFVAADNGIVYHIKDVFNGTAKVDFCALVSGNGRLTSPVYDVGARKLFVSDGNAVYKFDFDPATGFSNRASITVASNQSIILSPMVDGSTEMVYVFAGVDTTGTYSIASQIPYSFDTHVDARLGAAASGYLLNGTFDNNYYNDSATGTLYACGRETTNGNRPALYGMSFDANGVMNATPVLSNLTGISNGTSGTCSPLQEFYNGGVDRLFVGASGANRVSMFNITNRLTSSSTAAATASYNGGTSGFSVDNTSSDGQASSIYFGTLGTGNCGNGNYCAVKLTQGALQ